MTKNELIIDHAKMIFAAVAATATGLSDASLTERRNLYRKVSDYAFEMAEVFYAEATLYDKRETLYEKRNS